MCEINNMLDQQEAAGSGVNLSRPVPAQRIIGHGPCLRSRSSLKGRPSVGLPGVQTQAFHEERWD